jgi:transcriptional regulator with XRE-family HTH domain
MPSASNEPSDSSLLPKEVGRRLRLLREQAGLSQEAVAALMGLGGPGGKSYICQVECGYLKSGPKFVRVLDYLRACGCGIDALLDILDRHTAKDTVAEEQATTDVLKAITTLPPQFARRALYYHVGLTYKGRERVFSGAAAAERVRRAVARGKAEMWELRLRREFNNVLNELHMGWRDTMAVPLRVYGREVFATLRRLRKSKPVWRERALARLDERAVERGFDPAPLRRMKEAVTELFEKMERAGACENPNDQVPMTSQPGKGQSGKDEGRSNAKARGLPAFGLSSLDWSLALGAWSLRPGFGSD